MKNFFHPHEALIISDRQLICVLGYDKPKSKEAIFVYHAKKGIMLNKIGLK